MGPIIGKFAKFVYYTFKYSILLLLFLSFWISDYGGYTVSWVKGQLNEICQTVWICK